MARSVREHEGRRAAHDDEPDDDPVSVHRRGYDNLDAAVEWGVRDAPHRGSAVRVRVSRRQLSVAVDLEGREARRRGRSAEVVSGFSRTTRYNHPIWGGSPTIPAPTISRKPSLSSRCSLMVIASRRRRSSGDLAVNTAVGPARSYIDCAISRDERKA